MSGTSESKEKMSEDSHATWQPSIASRYQYAMNAIGIFTMGCMMDLAYPPFWRNCKSQTLYNEVPQIEGHTDTAVWVWRAAMLRNSQVRFGGGRLETQVMLCAGRLSYIVISCQYKRDAKRILASLVKRLEKYGLKLNQEKTRLVSFSKGSYSRGQKQEAFDFLGFTFYLGRSRKGFALPKVKSSGKRLRVKLKRVSEWARIATRRYRLGELWRRFRVKLLGHIRYYGVTFNGRDVGKFLNSSVRILYKWLERRSQRKSLTWEQFQQFIRANPLPVVKIYHKLYQT